MNISYTKNGDYLLPDLKLEDKERFNIGKYGLLKLEYLKKNKRVVYIELLMKDKLNEYLHDIDINLMDKEQKLIKELAKPDIYDYIDENMPEWARKPVQAAVDKGILKGDKENGWGLTYEDLKVLTWMHRAGIF